MKKRYSIIIFIALVVLAGGTFLFADDKDKKNKNAIKNIADGKVMELHLDMHIGQL